MPVAPERFRDWDAWISDIKNIEGLSETEKREAMESLSLLRELFGEDFLERAFERRHPIIWLLVNYASWTRRFLIWLARTLDALKSCENFERLLNGLRSEKTYDHTLIEADFAYRFMNAKFDVELYPKIEGGKEADLKIINPETSEKFYVEITSLGPSKYERDVMNSFSSISDLLLTALLSKLIWAGKVHKYVSEPHLAEVLSTIENAIQRAQTKGFAEVIEEGTLEIAIATEGNRSLLEKWASERGLRVGELHGPSLNVNELLRLAGKIEKEQKQLCKGALNILIVWVKTPLLFLSRRGDVREVINFLEEYIYKHEHLAFCCICSSYLSVDDQIHLVHNQHLYVKRRRKNGLIEESMVLVNRFAKGRISLNSYSKIVRALMS